jgi:hypothetical protein
LATYFQLLIYAKINFLVIESQLVKYKKPATYSGSRLCISLANYYMVPVPVVVVLVFRASLRLFILVLRSILVVPSIVPVPFMLPWFMVPFCIVPVVPEVVPFCIVPVVVPEVVPLCMVPVVPVCMVPGVVVVVVAGVV